MTKRKIEVVDASDEMDWLTVWSEGMKNHCVHKCLLAPLIADLESRGAPVHRQERVDKASHEEIHGPWIKGRPLEQVKIDLLKFSVPSRDVDLTIHHLASLPERTFANGEKYYKLKDRWGCIVFTPDQRDLLIEGLIMLVEEAEERDREFLDGWEKRMKDKKKG